MRRYKRRATDQYGHLRPRGIVSGARLGAALGRMMQMHMEDPTIDPRATSIAREMRAAFRQLFANFGAVFDAAMADPAFRRLCADLERAQAEEDAA